MSTIYEKLLVNLSLCPDSQPPPSAGRPRQDVPPPAMDKSVFARVLKVVIQCVEEGSALLHTFKMEGDISNTRITIEFHSRIHSSTGSVSGFPGDSGPGDPQPHHQPRPDMKPTERPSSRSQSPLRESDYSDTGSGKQIPMVSSVPPGEPANVEIQQEEKTQEVEQLPGKDQRDNTCSDETSSQQKTEPIKKDVIPNGSTPLKVKDSRRPQQPGPPPKSSRPAPPPPTNSQSVFKSSKKAPKYGAQLNQVIQDQNRIPPLRKQRSQDDLDEKLTPGSAGWAFDTNQNTVQRKNRNPITKSASFDLIEDAVSTKGASPKLKSPVANGSASGHSKSHVPIEANVILTNHGQYRPDSYGSVPDSRTKNAPLMSELQGVTGGIFSHPSLITRLGKMSERGEDGAGYGSSDEDSFDSDESLDMVTDTRQFGNKGGGKKAPKKRKGVISL